MATEPSYEIRSQVGSRATTGGGAAPVSVVFERTFDNAPLPTPEQLEFLVDDELRLTLMWATQIGRARGESLHVSFSSLFLAMALGPSRVSRWLAAFLEQRRGPRRKRRRGRFIARHARAHRRDAAARGLLAPAACRRTDRSSRERALWASRSLWRARVAWRGRRGDLRPHDHGRVRRWAAWREQHHGIGWLDWKHRRGRLRGQLAERDRLHVPPRRGPERPLGRRVPSPARHLRDG